MLKSVSSDHYKLSFYFLISQQCSFEAWPRQQHARQSSTTKHSKTYSFYPLTPPLSGVMVTRVSSQKKTSGFSNYELLLQQNKHNNILPFCFPSKVSIECVLIVLIACFLHSFSSPFQRIPRQLSVFPFVVCICTHALVLGVLSTKML